MAYTKNRKAIAGIMLILGALIYLGFVGYEESKAYYRTVEEVQSLEPHEMSMRFKVGGDVEEGSIVWNGAGVDFRLIQEDQALVVEYRGSDPVPDTFRDGSQAIVEGTMGSDGVFLAVKIQAKCASKYEAEYDTETHSVSSPASGDA